MKILIFPVLCAMMLLFACDGNDDDPVSNPGLGDFILVSSITPAENSVLHEDDTIEAVLQYQMYDHYNAGDDYQITIFFATTDGYGIVFGDSPSLSVTEVSAIVNHMYTVDFNDLHYSTIEKPYEVYYSLERKLPSGDYWESLAKTRPCIYREPD